MLGCASIPHGREEITAIVHELDLGRECVVLPTRAPSMYHEGRAHAELMPSVNYLCLRNIM